MLEQKGRSKYYQKHLINSTLNQNETKNTVTQAFADAFFNILLFLLYGLYYDTEIYERHAGTVQRPRRQNNTRVKMNSFGLRCYYRDVI